MTATAPVKTISASPQKLQWYHWVYIFLTSAAVLATALAGWFLFFVHRDYTRQDGRVTPGKMVALFLFACTFWYHSAFAILRKKILAEYDDTRLLSFEGPELYLHEPLLFSQFARALRRSEYCVEFSVDVAAAAKFGVRSANRHPLEGVRIEGNEKDLDDFCAALTRSGLVVEANPIPDDDPLKENTVRVLSVVLIILGVLGALVAAIKLTAK